MDSINKSRGILNCLGFQEKCKSSVWLNRRMHGRNIGENDREDLKIRMTLFVRMRSSFIYFKPSNESFFTSESKNLKI